MSQHAVERTLGKLLTDEKFRERFFDNPETACWEAGLTLSPTELEALSRVPRVALVGLHENLDKRISRASLDPDHEAGKVNGHVTPGTAPKGPTPGRRLHPRVIVAAGLLVAGLAGFGVWQAFSAGPDVSPGVIPVSGRIEGDDSAVAAKTSGRIREITVREGDRVEAGQVIATPDDQQQIRAREQQAAAAVRQAEARVQLEGRVSEAEARLAAAEAQPARETASYSQAKWDRDAFARLFKQELVVEQQARQAENNEEAQAAVVAASRPRPPAVP